MTYCLGMLLNEGMVFASDSRTNAGVDHVATFRKMRVFENPDERVVVLLSAGNLAITQSVIGLMAEAERANRQRLDGIDDRPTLLNAPSLFAAARVVGEAVREVHRMDGADLREQGIDYNVSLLLGGQIRGEAPRLFQIYAAGNFIEAAAETPFLQIGETKYGKPILDRVITPETELVQAAKCALVSLDSTMRSNISVGPPIDLLCYRADTYRVTVQRQITENDPYLMALRKQWGDGVRQLFISLPEPKWVRESGVFRVGR